MGCSGGGLATEVFVTDVLKLVSLETLGDASVCHHKVCLAEQQVEVAWLRLLKDVLEEGVRGCA